MTGPRWRVHICARIDEFSWASQPGFGAHGGAGVDAPADALGPAGVDLISQGIGEGLGRYRAIYGVAVVVEVCVDFWQGKGAVLTEDAQADGAERWAGEVASFWADGRKWRTTDCWWSAALLPWHDGPEPVAKDIDHGQCLEAFISQDG